MQAPTTISTTLRPWVFAGFGWLGPEMVCPANGAGIAPIGGTSCVNAAIGSTTPYPVAAFGPAAGVWAVRLMRSITAAADSSGNRERTSATTPETNGAAKLVPLTGTRPRWGACQAFISPGPFGLSDVSCSPGAARPTHGP